MKMNLFQNNCVVFITVGCVWIASADVGLELPILHVLEVAGIPFNSSFSSDMTIDNDTATYWDPAFGLPYGFNNWYIVYELNGCYNLTFILLMNYGDINHDVTSFKLELSDDLQLWHWIGSNNHVEIGYSNYQIFDVFNNVHGRYIKFTVLKTHEGFQPWLREIKFFGFECYPLAEDHEFYGTEENLTSFTYNLEDFNSLKEGRETISWMYDVRNNQTVPDETKSEMNNELNETDGLFEVIDSTTTKALSIKYLSESSKTEKSDYDMMYIRTGKENSIFSITTISLDTVPYTRLSTIANNSSNSAKTMSTSKITSEPGKIIPDAQSKHRETISKKSPNSFTSTPTRSSPSSLLPITTTESIEHTNVFRPMSSSSTSQATIENKTGVPLPFFPFFSKSSLPITTEGNIGSKVRKIEGYVQHKNINDIKSNEVYNDSLLKFTTDSSLTKYHTSFSLPEIFPVLRVFRYEIPKSTDTQKSTNIITPETTISPLPKMNTPFFPLSTVRPPIVSDMNGTELSLSNVSTASLGSSPEQIINLRIVNSSWVPIISRHTAENEIDNNISTVWKPFNTQGKGYRNWDITFELDGSYSISSVWFVNYGDIIHDIEVFNLELSDDNENWKNIGYFANARSGHSHWQVFDTFQKAFGKFLRFTVTKTHGDHQPWFREMKFFGNQNIRLEVELPILHVLEAAGVPFNSSFTPEMTVDNNTATYWDPAFGLPYGFNNWYIVYELDGRYNVTFILLMNHGNISHDMTSFKLELSEDLHHWHWIGSNERVLTGYSNYQIFDGFKTGHGRYIKFTVLKTYEEFQPCLREIKFFGYEQ